jgi:formylglycine-generating enzyme required for sulfatase activity
MLMQPRTFSRQFAALVRLAIVATCVAWSMPVSAEATAKTFRDCPECPLMATVPSNNFDMGSAVATEGNGDEVPRHRVTFAKPFAVGIHEVTRGEFARFVTATGYDAGNDCNVLVDEEWRVTPGLKWSNPGFEQTDDEPVVCVNWPAARAYAGWLAKRTHRPYRLLSEAEWEYVARLGGVADAPSHDTVNYGAETCCQGLRQGKDRWLHTAPVGSFAPDRFGLHDVLGNVWEWLEDCYHESYAGTPTDGSPRTTNCSGADRRVVRGGGYGDAAWLLRPGYRLRGPLAARYATLGFRVALTLE